MPWCKQAGENAEESGEAAHRTHCWRFWCSWCFVPRHCFPELSNMKQNSFRKQEPCYVFRSTQVTSWRAADSMLVEWKTWQGFSFSFLSIWLFWRLYLFLWLGNSGSSRAVLQRISAWFFFSFVRCIQDAITSYSFVSKQTNRFYIEFVQLLMVVVMKLCKLVFLDLVMQEWGSEMHLLILWIDHSLASAIKTTLR